MSVLFFPPLALAGNQRSLKMQAHTSEGVEGGATKLGAALWGRVYTGPDHLSCGTAGIKKRRQCRGDGKQEGGHVSGQLAAVAGAPSEPGA